MSESNTSTASSNSTWRSFLDGVRYLAPHFVLVLVYISYLVFGGLVFSALESSTYAMLSDEEHAKLDLAHRTKLRIIEAFNDRSNSSSSQELNISLVLDSLIDTVNHPDWKAGREKTLMDGRGWSFPSAILFAMTTITTIGYGDLVPETFGGKIFCVIFSIIGVPFSFYLLADVGQQLAIGFINFYRWLFCKNCRSWADKRKERDERVYGIHERRRRSGQAQRPNVTMRHMQSVRFNTTERDTHPATSGAGHAGRDTNSCPVEYSDWRGQHAPKTVRASTLAKCAPQIIHDGGIELSEIESNAPGGERLNANNSALDQPSSSNNGGECSVSTISNVYEIPEQQLHRSNNSDLGDDQTMSTLYSLYESHDQNNHQYQRKKKEPVQEEKKREAMRFNARSDGNDEATSGRSADKSGYHADDIPAWLVFLTLVGYTFISAFAFTLVEGWDLGTAAYFTFITLTTIGFGDVVPQEQYTGARFFFCLLFTVTGLAVTSMCIALAQERVCKHGRRFFEFIDQRISSGDDDGQQAADLEVGHPHSNSSQG